MFSAYCIRKPDRYGEISIYIEVHNDILSSLVCRFLEAAFSIFAQLPPVRHFLPSAAVATGETESDKIR